MEGGQTADLRVVEESKPTTLEGLVEDYLANCRARGLSPKTIRDNYGYALRSMFLPWATEAGSPSRTTSRAACSTATRATCWSTAASAGR